MEIKKIEGFILSSTPYNESSKILNILTREYGIIGVMSKGCKNAKSKLKIVSENFTYAFFYMYYKEGKISTLIGADIINYFSNIKSDITRVSFMTYLSELTKNVYKHEESSEIYDLFISSLMKIDEGFNPLVISNILELKYLDYLGVSINLDGCVVCGSKSIVTLSYLKGGYVCKDCRTTEPIINEKVLKTLRLYYYVDISKISKLDISDNVTHEIDRFLNVYYDNYTGLYLKSKKFLETLKNIEK